MCWCVATLMVGRAVVVDGPPDGGALFGGVWHPSWWGVLRWYVAPLLLGHVRVRCDPPHGGARCVGVRCVVLCGGVVGVLCWGVAPRMVGHAALVCGPPHGGAVVRCDVVCVALRCAVCGGGVWPP